jgi:hypothetical protein
MNFTLSKKIIEPKFIIIATAIAIAIILFLLLAAYYRSSLLNINGVLDKDFFPAFGSFLSSTTGVVISLGSILLIYYTYQSQQEQLKITKGLVNRQIALSIKPDVVIQDYYTTDKPLNELESVEHMFDGMLPNDLHGIGIKVLNVGIEVARYLEYNFEYDVTGLIAYMNNSFSSPPLKLIYEPNKLFGEVTRIETGVVHYINILSSSQLLKKDYLMPYKLDKDYLMVLFPGFYVMVYYYILVGKFKDSIGFDTDIKDLPMCVLNISYNDLEGVKHRKKFNLKLELLGGVELLKPEQAANLELKISSAEIS